MESESIAVGHTCLIVCAGEFPARNIIRQLRYCNQTAICADGALKDINIYMPGFKTDFVIGDFDSLSIEAADSDPNHPRYIKAEDQEITDAEKCLRYALSHKAKNIDIVGFQGKRLDHTINNLSLLRRYHGHADIRLWNNTDVVVYRSSNFFLRMKPEQRISFIPLFEDVTFGLCSGVSYPLDGLTLNLNDKISVSNLTDKEEVSIEIVRGSTLVIYDHTTREL